MNLTRPIAWLYLASGVFIGLSLGLESLELALIRAGFFMFAVSMAGGVVKEPTKMTNQIAIGGAALFVLASIPPARPDHVAIGAAVCVLSALSVGIVTAKKSRAVFVAFAVIAFGFSIDALAPLFAEAAHASLEARMMRLSQVSAIALPLLFLMTRDSVGASSRSTRWPRIAELLVLVGACLMPVILTLSAQVSATLKYLLAIPADAVSLGIVMTAVLALKRGKALEGAGFALVGASMGVGLLMGGYAFDGPLPSPVGEYAEPARAMLRHGHVLAIVLGGSWIALAQGLAASRSELNALALTFEGTDLDRLNRGSLTKSFVPETDIDWTKETTDEELAELYDVWSLLKGTGKDASFSVEDRIHYAKCQQIILMRFTALLERHGIHGIARLYDAEGCEGLTEYLGHFIKEETYHFTMFSRAISQLERTLGEREAPPWRTFEFALKSLFRLVSFIPSKRLRIVMTFTIFRFAEQVTMYAHDMVRKTLKSRDGLVAQVWARHAMDEARHLKFDDMVIERLRTPGSRLPEILALPACVMVSLFLNGSEIWVARRLGARVHLWELPSLMRASSAPFKRRVFNLVQKIARGPVQIELEAGADA